MKKILLAISALSAAMFSTAANADISVGGSMKAVYVDAEGNADAHIGGAISFSMSTTTDGGVTISAGGSISNDNDATGNNTTATGLTSLTFGFANGSYAVLEVKTNEVPFLLEDGQTIARIKYEKLNKNSNIVYGKDIKSNYQNQGLKLSKHFK